MVQNVLQTTKAKCKLVWLTPAQTAPPASEITHVQGKHRRQVTWISDTQCGDTKVLSTRCTEFNVVAGVVVDSGLCQHCIVLNLALPINNTTTQQYPCTAQTTMSLTTTTSRHGQVTDQRPRRFWSSQPSIALEQEKSSIGQGSHSNDIIKIQEFPVSISWPVLLVKYDGISKLTSVILM